MIANFDAELELARGAGYTRRRSFVPFFEGLVATHVAPRWPLGTTFLVEARPRTERDGRACLAWSPTPQAERLAEASGLSLDHVVRPEILRQVNERDFARSLGDVLEVIKIEDEASLDASLARALARGAVVVKRGLSASGRGMLRLDGPPTTVEHISLVRALDDAPLYVEPHVDIVVEWSVHGWVTDVVTITSVRAPSSDAAGRYVGSRWLDAGTLEPAHRTALFDEAARTGEALGRAGYRGPFGVDAFLFRDPHTGTPVLRPRSELNARYCMGWDDIDGFEGPPPPSRRS